MNNFLFPADMLVSVDVNGNPYTTSLVLAEKFKKQHKDVLHAIRKEIEHIGNIKISTLDEIAAATGYELDLDGRRNFTPSSYANEQNKQQPMYLLNRDGYMSIVMGFTGQEAAAWRLAFTAAFTHMENELKAHQARIENAYRQQHPHHLTIMENPHLSRQELIDITGHKSTSSITANRRRMRELGLLQNCPTITT